MKVALESFVSGIGKRGAKLEECFFVLGDMNELGEKTPEFHAEIGQLIEVLGISQVAFVGRYGKHYKKGFASGKLYASTEQLAESWPQLKNSYRYFFLKGSRTLQLESLIDI